MPAWWIALTLVFVGVASVATWLTATRRRRADAPELPTERPELPLTELELGRESLAGAPASRLIATWLTLVQRDVDATSVELFRHLPTRRILVREALVGRASGPPERLADATNRLGRCLLGGEPKTGDGSPDDDPDRTSDAGVTLHSLAVPVGVHPRYGVLDVRSERPFGIAQIEAIHRSATAIAPALRRRTADDEIDHPEAADPATGVFSDALFADRLLRSVQRSHADRHDAPRVLIVSVEPESPSPQGSAAWPALAADRARACLRPVDTLAASRHGHLRVLLADGASPANVGHVAQRLLTAFAPPVTASEADAHSLTEGARMTAHVGISLGADVVSPEGLLAEADDALASSQAAVSGHPNEFNPAFAGLHRGPGRIEGELRSAIDRDELELVYQPTVELRSGAIVGAEAFVRWNHPDLGERTPADFLAVAERSELAFALDRWVITRAAAQTSRWNEASDGTRMTVSVNMSQRTLLSDETPAMVSEAILDAGVDSRYVSFELAETSVLADVDAATETMERLRALGCTVALDDIGLGSTTIGELRGLPLDLVKLDRRLVAELDGDPASPSVCELVMTLGHTLGLVVIAQGVETAAQLAELAALDCDLGQGYFFGRPMGPDALTFRIRNQLLT